MDSLRRANGLAPRSAGTPPSRPVPGDSAPALVARDAAVLVRGRAIYERDCVQCHGVGGKGSPAVVAMFQLPPETMDLTRKNLDGYSPDSLSATLKGGKGEMPEYQKALSREDAHAILEYLRRLREE